MAVTVIALAPYRDGFARNATSTDASGCESIYDAPGSGISIYLEQVTISVGATMNVTIGAGETAGAVTSTIIGPIYFAAAGSVGPIRFSRPIKLAANTALTFDSSASGNVTIVAEGYVE